MSGEKKRATYQDLEDLPPHVVGELIDGELFVSRRPAMRPAIAKMAVNSIIGGAFALRAGTWWILLEPELHFGDDVIVPDVVGWCKERLPQLPDVPFMTLAPDWVCEVLSPETARLDLACKLPVYAKNGVGHVWIIEPQLRTFEAFRSDGKSWKLEVATAGDVVVRVAPFDAIELPLGELWVPGAAQR